MPKSKVRKKDDVAVRPTSISPSASRGLAPSPSWYPILMAIVFLVGLAYIVVWYLAPDNGLMKGLHAWNLAVGFGILVVGLIMAVRWR